MTHSHSHAPDSHSHRVQFFGLDEALMIRNVATYLGESLTLGGGALVIATAVHGAAIAREIERIAGPPGAALVTLDAATTLDEFMTAGKPDASQFDATIGERVRATCASYRRVRAYGEMVGLLWQRKQTSAAIALERLWNDVLNACPLELYCGYPIDVLGHDFQIAAVDPLLTAHSDVVPATNARFEAALQRALDDVLRPPVTGLRLLGAGRPGSWPTLPYTERTVLWLRNNLSRLADEIIDKAREYYAG